MASNIVDEVTKNITGLRTARKAAGLTQQQLAGLIGTNKANIAGMESAARSMSYKMGKRLSEHVDVPSAELVLASRLNALRKAEEERDAAGVLQAAKTIVELADSETLTPEGEEFIDAIADRALKFAGVGAVGKSSGAGDHVHEEEYDEPGHDGRDINGHRIAPLDGTADDYEDEEADEDEIEEDEEYDEPGHDGRDHNGHRIAPLGGI